MAVESGCFHDRLLQTYIYALESTEVVALTENKQKSEVVEEAIREYFKKKWRETTKSFLISRFSEEILEEVT